MDNEDNDDTHKIIVRTPDDLTRLYNEFLKLNYDDPETNTPLKLMSARVNIIGCGCSPEMISSRKFCENCLRIERVNSSLLRVFKNDGMK